MYNTVAAGLTSLIGSIAESARYLSARDNHVIGVMSHCESNKSLGILVHPVPLCVSARDA